ncbi:MnhB domain-containing protein [Amaricoccus solimangrovi]|uniref:Na(+)/H(+) antiporter subunit B n=1 Tax=Amaricoccus solimangrovi TaxID=2589815 RepID=A0A501WXK0_9RHOB|nr:MnhB domain-containing protein [Amaricoccus solimangrovi]TPE52177.1 Na(+)/H(+) antiporter subunit B [Amaricoccus solimangrovi]
MNSLILSTAARFLIPVILALSLFIFWRGHNEPGGGFIGGLLAATAFALLAKASGTAKARRTLYLRPRAIAAFGLGCALVGGIWGGLATGAFLKGMWPFLTIDAEGHKHGLPFGSIMLFDFGVYLVVLGTVTGILFALEDSLAEDAAGAEDVPLDKEDGRWR